MDIEQLACQQNQEMEADELLDMQNNPSISILPETQIEHQDECKEIIPDLKDTFLGLATHNLYILSDCPVPLLKVILPANFVSKTKQTWWFSANSRCEMSANYDFGLVKSTDLISNGLHFLF